MTDMKQASLIVNITTLFDYMWDDEKKHYHESDCPREHVFITLKNHHKIVAIAECIKCT